MAKTLRQIMHEDATTDGTSGSTTDGRFKPGAPKKPVVAKPLVTPTQSPVTMKTESDEFINEKVDSPYMKAMHKYVKGVAYDYMNGGSEHLYGVNKFDHKTYGVDSNHAQKDYDKLFQKYVKKLNEDIVLVDINEVSGGHDYAVVHYSPPGTTTIKQVKYSVKPYTTEKEVRKMHQKTFLSNIHKVIFERVELNELSPATLVRYAGSAERSLKDRKTGIRKAISKVLKSPEGKEELLRYGAKYGSRTEAKEYNALEAPGIQDAIKRMGQRYKQEQAAKQKQKLADRDPSKLGVAKIKEETEGKAMARKMIAEGRIEGFRPPFSVSGNWVNDSRGRGICEMGESREALKDIAAALNMWVQQNSSAKSATLSSKIKIKEETEQLSELSKQTLSSYVTKARSNVKKTEREIDDNDANQFGIGYDAWEPKKHSEIPKVRKMNIKKAEKRIGESTEDTHKVRQLAGKMKALHARAKAYSVKHGCVAHINKDDDGEHHISDWYDSDKTVATYNKGKLREDVQLDEGRPSQRHPLEGHEYHRKTDAELIYIAKDAHKAAEAMKGHNTNAENKYRDQANDSATVRYFRQKNGMPEWYKKKYGHIKESLSESIVGTVREAFKDAKIRDAKKKTEKKVTSGGKDKFEPDPELSTQITKQDY